MSHQFYKPGIPQINTVLLGYKSRLFNLLIQYSNNFLQGNRSVLSNYPWIVDAINQWSRIYEYPFCYHHLTQNLCGRAKILDAGSGITFFPFFLDSRFSILCLDQEDYSFEFETINRNQTTSVGFIQGSMQAIPLPDDALDGIYSISVLEHTRQYTDILHEFHRILKSGGLLLLTFDIALDENQDGIDPQSVIELIETINRLFDCDYTTEDFEKNLLNEYLYTTVFTQRWKAHLLPWPQKTIRLVLRNFIRRKGKTVYFQDDIQMTFCCLVARKS